MHPPHRREPDRGPPGRRRAHEAGAPPRREAHRRRPAAHRARGDGRRPPAAPARHERRRSTTGSRTSSSRDGLCDRAFLADARRRLRGVPRVHPRPTTRRASRRSRGVPAALDREGGAPLRVARARQRSSTASASPSRRRASPGVRCLANLALLTGNLGKPRRGLNPLRGQNNVQGSSDVGALPTYLHDVPEDGRRRRPRSSSRRSGAAHRPERGL